VLVIEALTLSGKYMIKVYGLCSHVAAVADSAVLFGDLMGKRCCVFVDADVGYMRGRSL
jgi:hypothetical protein